jgi:protein phosphatase
MSELPPDVESITAESLGEAAVAASRVHAEIAGMTHPGVRPNNEDAYAIFRIGRYMERMDSNIPESEMPSRHEESGHLLLVADGVGGAEGGEVASRMSLRTILDLVQRAPRWALKLDDPQTRHHEIQGLITRSRGYLQSMHAAVRARQVETPALASMGTTLTGAYTVGVDLFVLHVGDSRAYLLREGKLARITHDHTLAQQYADLGLVPQDAVESHPLGHVLTRALGSPVDEIQSDMHHVPLQDGDTLMLCSDGLTKMLTEDRIAAILGEHADSSIACRELVKNALLAGGKDNVTVIVARYTID